jgi:hypothetical protein
MACIGTALLLHIPKSLKSVNSITTSTIIATHIHNYYSIRHKIRLNSGNACYHSVQGLLSSRLLSRNVKLKIYKTIILPVVLYGCETWSLMLREEHSLRVFENRVLRRIFGPKRDEVTGEWRKLHNVEIHNLYSSPDITRQVKSRGACGTHGRGDKTVEGFGGKARRKETTWKTKA